ncbi:MAG: glucose-1-phosphate adenylyltransferase [Acidobacteriota bacterium]|jgi:glucose-1-phosphate adenylyltransferase
MSPRTIASLLQNTLVLVLAGGQGERLHPLTRDRAKPAVPFAGKYRIIDFTLSNCVNSGLRRIYVLTQYKSVSLDRHLREGWNILSSALGEFLYTIPPQFRTGERWYEGTADAVFQNIYTLEHERPDRVLILSGDHVYKMDYSAMVEEHVRTGASVTVAAAECRRDEATRMGVLIVSEDGRILEFDEKPADPRPMPGKPDHSLVNMGVYVFNRDALVKWTSEDAAQETDHDFGRNILPAMVARGEEVRAHSFHDRNGKPEKYWRDIGTLDSYYEASMDLVSVDPRFNLYAEDWPIRSSVRPRPPAKLVFADTDGRRGEALDSLLCHGCIISGGQVERSILSPDVLVRSYSRVEKSILFEGVKIGRKARVRHAIIDKGVSVPPGFRIGYDPEEDASRFTVTRSGLVVIPRETVLEP